MESLRGLGQVELILSYHIQTCLENEWSKILIKYHTIQKKVKNQNKLSH